jgi:hypothetical protein
MRALWSFWSEPLLTSRKEAWLAPKYHLFAWVLSVELARQHFDELVLYSDNAGADLLVEQLRLPFTEVSRDLNQLQGTCPDWWALGKLCAYTQQRKPFVHLDTDVFLWKTLPAELTAAPVFAQNPEFITFHQCTYEPEWFERALAARPGTWLPEAWRWYRKQPCPQIAPNCGIVGGSDVELLRDYAAQALELLKHPSNSVALESLGNRIGHMILVEQYFLGAIAHHRGVPIRYLFSSFEEAFDPANAAEKGFTHLISDAKRSPVLSDRLEVRIQRDYPEYYERCLAIAERSFVAEAQIV